VKTKTLKGFFGFWVVVALVSFWLRNEKPKHSLKSFGVLVFWCSRGFGYFVFPKIQPKSRKL
jgi:TctA family transporter